MVGRIRLKILLGITHPSHITRVKPHHKTGMTCRLYLTKNLVNGGKDIDTQSKLQHFSCSLKPIAHGRAQPALATAIMGARNIVNKTVTVTIDYSQNVTKCQN